MKKKIPTSLKQNIWMLRNGEQFKAKCYVKWCENILTPFTFEAGHDIPESKGGSTTVDNLYPICSSCNKSMGNRYSIQEYCDVYKERKNVDKENMMVIPVKTRMKSTWCFSCIPFTENSEKLPSFGKPC